MNNETKSFNLRDPVFVEMFLEIIDNMLDQPVFEAQFLKLIGIVYDFGTELVGLYRNSTYLKPFQVVEEKIGKSGAPHPPSQINVTFNLKRLIYSGQLPANLNRVFSFFHRSLRQESLRKASVPPQIRSLWLLHPRSSQKPYLNHPIPSRHHLLLLNRRAPMS